MQMRWLPAVTEAHVDVKSFDQRVQELPSV